MSGNIIQFAVSCILAALSGCGAVLWFVNTLACLTAKDPAYRQLLAKDAREALLVAILCACAMAVVMFSMR